MKIAGGAFFITGIPPDFPMLQKYYVHACVYA